MTADEVIAMAQRAGYPHGGLNWNDQERAFLMRFAALVAAREREACAQICDHFANAKDYGGNEYMRSKEAQLAAARIRARGAP